MVVRLGEAVVKETKQARMRTSEVLAVVIVPGKGSRVCEVLATLVSEAFGQSMRLINQLINQSFIQLIT